MPTHRIALVEGGPKSLVIKRSVVFSKTTIVTFEGVELGRFSSRAELFEGRTFALPDGTSLLVRLDPAKPAFLFGEPEKLRVERDGALLRGAPAHPASVVATGAGLLLLVSAATIVFGAITAAGADAAGGIGMIIEGLIYGGLGWAATREKRWALIVGLGLYLLDTAFAIASMTPGGWPVRVIVIFSLIRAIRVHPELAKVDAASVADVFR